MTKQKSSSHPASLPFQMNPQVITPWTAWTAYSLCTLAHVSFVQIKLRVEGEKRAAISASGWTNGIQRVSMSWPSRSKGPTAPWLMHLTWQLQKNTAYCIKQPLPATKKKKKKSWCAINLFNVQKSERKKNKRIKGSGGRWSDKEKKGNNIVHLGERVRIQTGGGKNETNRIKKSKSSERETRPRSPFEAFLKAFLWDIWGAGV